MQNISTRIKKVRDALNMTQSDFAAAMRYGRHYISLLERGKAERPSARFLDQLSIMEREVEAESSVAYTSRGDNKYSSAPSQSRAAPSNMPPHQLPPSRLREEPQTISKHAFAQCVTWLSELHHNRPEAFQTVAAMLKGLCESENKS